MHSNRPVEEVLCDCLKHVAKLEERIEDLEDSMKRIVPNQDYDGHGMYHQCLIDKERRRAKLVDSIMEKTLSGLIWSAVLAVGLAVWSYIKLEIKK